MRSLNCMTCGVVLGPQVSTKRMAAARAVGSFSSIEAEVSIMRTSEIGMSSWLKIESSWRTPSSKTAKSFLVRSVT